MTTSKTQNETSCNILKLKAYKLGLVYYLVNLEYDLAAQIYTYNDFKYI